MRGLDECNDITLVDNFFESGDAGHRHLSSTDIGGQLVRHVNGLLGMQNFVGIIQDHRNQINFIGKT
jgi:hypothetical protein